MLQDRVLHGWLELVLVVDVDDLDFFISWCTYWDGTYFDGNVFLSIIIFSFLSNKFKKRSTTLREYSVHCLCWNYCTYSHQYFETIEPWFGNRLRSKTKSLWLNGHLFLAPSLISVKSFYSSHSITQRERKFIIKRLLL